MGLHGNRPAAEVDDAFFDQERLGRLRRKILMQPGAKPSNDGVRSSTAARFQLSKEIGEDFFKDTQATKEIHIGVP